MRLTEQRTGIEQRPAQKGVGSTGIKNARDTKWQMQTVVTAECYAQELITLFFLLCAWVKLLIPNRKAGRTGLLGEVEVTVSYFTYISVKMEMQCSRSAHKSVQDIREARRRASCVSCGLGGVGLPFQGSQDRGKS